MQWLRSAVQVQDLQDLASSWNDGVNLSALVDYCQPGLIPDHASLNPENRLENVKRAMDLAEKHLQVPQLMHPDDLAVDKPDKLSTMTYLSQFCCPDSVGEKALLEFVRQKLPKQNITNFTTDWVDGHVLEALVAEVCEYEPQASLASSTDRCKGAMMAAEDHFFMRQILEASEFSNHEIDPRLRMAFLTEIYHATQRPRIIDTHVPEACGVGKEVVVNLEVPQHGSIDATAVGASTGSATLTTETLSDGRLQVKISVPVRDQYTVSISHCGRVLRGCPFIVALDSYSVPHVKTIEPKRVGDTCCITFDISELDGKSMDIKVTGETMGEMEHMTDNASSNCCNLTFIPPCPDTYAVALSVAGKLVKESPFVLPLIDMADPMGVKCGEVVSNGVTSPVSLAIDCAGAGKGALTASCSAMNSGEVPVHIIAIDGTPTSVTFTPESEDLYLLQVLYEGREVPGSPWSIDFRNLPPQPDKVRIEETPKDKIEVGKMLSVSFDTSAAGSGHLTASCNGTKSGNVPVCIVMTGLGKFQVGFVPKMPDNYFVSVSWAGVLIPGAPFQISLGCEPVNASKCKLMGLIGNPALVKVKGVYEGFIGQELVLHVKTVGAGETKLDVQVQSPSKNITLDSQRDPDDPKTQIVHYTPVYQGHHSIQLLWGGNTVPGSPVTFKAVSPLVFPLRKPITLKLDFDGKKKHLTAEAVLQKQGLPVKVFATIDDVVKKTATFSLDFSQMEAGTYVFYAYCKYKELPRSPVIFLYGVEEDSDNAVATEETDSSSEVIDQVTPPDKTPSSVVTGEQIRAALIPVVARVGEVGCGADVATAGPKSKVIMPEGQVASLDATSEMVTETMTERAEVAEVVDVALLESVPSENNPRSTSPPVDNVLETLGRRPKTTTPTQSEHAFAMPNKAVSSKEILKSESASSSPDALPLSPPSDALSHSEISSPQEAMPITEFVSESKTEPVVDESETISAKSEVKASAEGLVDELETTAPLREQQGEKTPLQVKDEKDRGEKVGKKKDKDEQKARSKKEREREKTEKAEKAKLEKEEKKKKKQGKKKEAGGLNLEEQEFRVGVKVRYKLHCDALGSKTPVVSCNPPGSAKHDIIPAPQFGKNTYWCELTPTQVGNMKVSIVYEDFHIMDSPFSVIVGPRGDASQCTMVETASTCTRQLKNSLLFCIDVPESAGKGKLQASVRSAADNRRITGVLTTAVTNHHYHIEFVPSEGLEYMLGVKYDDRHIKGSPFAINLGDPAKCIVSGEGLKQAHMDEENTFTVDALDAGPGELSVNIEREGKPIEKKITMTSAKQYRVSYTVDEPGVYRVSVQWGEDHVRNSPFDVHCIAASQFRVSGDGIHRAYAGGMVSFQVVASGSQIRRKQLSVFAHPKANISKMFSGEIVQSSEGFFTCSLQPTHAHVGPCNVHICWNGKEIQGSPYELDVADPPKPEDFILEAIETATGDVAIHVTGPKDVFATDAVAATVENIVTNEKVGAMVTKLTNEKYSVQILPTTGGEYQLSILYAGRHVGNSPFFLTQSDPSQCKPSGEGLRLSRLNELSKFTVDHSKAGRGQLRVDIVGEEGDTIEPFIASGETLSEVSYISKSLGVYQVILHWGEHELPDSPFTMYTVDPSKFTVVKGNLAKQIPLNQTIKFSILSSGAVAEWERLSVTAKLIHQQQVYKGMVSMEGNHKEPTYKCSLSVPVEGHYAVYVQCRGLDIPGSPFKIRMVPSPQPDKVRVYGEGVKNGVIGQKRQFLIDTKEAAHGHISLKVTGPSCGVSVDMHHSETSERVVVAEYTPVYAGVYTIHVMWAGFAVPGSPFTVSIRNLRKGEVLNNRDKEWVSGRY